MTNRQRNVVVVMVVILAFALGLAVGKGRSISANSQISQQPVNNDQAQTSYPQEQSNDIQQTQQKLGLGSVINVGNFEVSFTKYEVVAVDNQFADFDEGLIITAEITNTSDETQSLIGVRINVFTPQGTEGESASHYFTDNYNPYLLDDLRSGSTYINHQIINYVGDGEYVIEVSTLLGDPVEIFFNVTK